METRNLASASWLLFAIDPFPDVRRTVAKRNPVALARVQEPDRVAIHEDDILEIQHDCSDRRFRGQQGPQFADVVRPEATTQGQDDITICLALDLQHSQKEKASAGPAQNAETTEV
jgi:hypothetical protein